MEHEPQHDGFDDASGDDTLVAEVADYDRTVIAIVDAPPAPEVASEGDSGIPTVTVGHADGWSQLVNRLLGLGDALEFDELGAQLVSEMQESFGLKVTGEVDYDTWAVLVDGADPASDPLIGIVAAHVYA